MDVSTLVYPVIIAAVPLSIAGLKALTNPPTWLLPVLAPVLGATADLISAYVANTAPNPVLGAALGGLGVWLREVVDQLKKTASS